MTYGLEPPLDTNLKKHVYSLFTSYGHYVRFAMQINREFE